MVTMTSRRRFPTGHKACVALALLVVALAGGGCSASNRRCAVAGRVAFDGQPIEEGVITLVPTGGSSGPTAGAEIRGGRYKIAASGGPLAGQTCRVEVIAMRKTGRRLPIVPGGPPAFDEKINFIPESYNVASKLVATIDAPRGVATLDFDLTQPSK